MQVKCPTCGVTFEAKRSDHGANYVHSWIELPEANMKLLVWLINNHALDWWEKAQIDKEYISSTPNAISGRISELYGLDLIEQKRLTKSKQQTEAAFDGKTVIYRLNLTKVSIVISNGGKLTDNFKGVVLT